MEPTYSLHKAALLRWARACLVYGVEHGLPPPVADGMFPPACMARRAVFVTLEKHGQLRGCIGHLEASQPLVKDIAENAVAAALHDTRFLPVKSGELPDIRITISILTPPERMTFASEMDLLRQLRPGVDGLIISEGQHQATFLPAVWEELPDPRDFLTQLKMKAGWAADYWSPRIKASRYAAAYMREIDA